MLFSIVLAWLAALCAAFTAVLYAIKRSRGRRLRKLFARNHTIAGLLLIATGALHGVLAGNVPGAALGSLLIAPLLFTWNWGTACLIASVLLAVTYLLRRRLKRRWMTLHRVCTVLMIALVALHLSEVGVQLFARLSPTAEQEPGMPRQVAASFSSASLADGAYQGSAQGYKGLITVSVTVTDGAVSGIDILSQTETPAYLRRAEAVISEIVQEQSLQVDAVAGATRTSAGIVNAVSGALFGTSAGETLAVPAYPLTGRRGKHGHSDSP